MSRTIFSTKGIKTSATNVADVADVQTAVVADIASSILPLSGLPSPTHIHRQDRVFFAMFNGFKALHSDQKQAVNEKMNVIAELVSGEGASVVIGNYVAVRDVADIPELAFEVHLQAQKPVTNVAVAAPLPDHIPAFSEMKLED